MSTANGRPYTVRSIGRRQEDHVRARLAAIVTCCADAIIGATPDGIIADWNPAAEHLFGYAAVEVIGQPLAMLIPRDRLAEAEAILARVRRGTSVAGVETDRRTKDGRRLAVSLTVSPVRNDAGELIATAAIVRDLSERKASEAQYRALVDQLPAVVYTEHGDAAHSLLYLSPYVTTLLGYAPEAFFAEPGLWMRRIHPDDQARVYAAYTRMDATGEPFREEYRLLAQDGHIVWVSDTATPVRDAAGQLLFWQGVALDATARKAAEEALAASEHRFQTAFDHAPIGMALVDPEGRIFQVNHALGTMLGHGAAELVGMRFQDFVHPEDVASSLALLRSLLAGERETYEAEKRQFRKDGQLVWAQVSISVVRDDAGAPRYLIAQIQDTTQRHQLTEDVRASEAKYRTLVELLPALVYTVAADNVQSPLYFSPYLEALTGYRPEEILARTHHWLEAVHPEDRGRVAAADARALASGGPLRVEYRYRRRDGSYVWVLDQSIHLRDESGAVVAWQGVLLDISGRKQLEEDLRASEAKYRTLVELLPALVYVVVADDARTPRYFSPYLETLTGYLPEEAMARTYPWLETVHPEDRDRVAAEDARALAIGKPLRIEYRYRCKDGSFVWVLEESIFLRDEHGAVAALHGVLLDISERRQAEAALAEALEAAQKATRSKSLFLAMMSHELRTPLQAIFGYADFLLTGGEGPLTPDQTEDVSYIRRGAERMIALIDQMLDLSRLEAGRLELATKPVDLADLLRQVRQDVAPQASSKGLALDLEVTPSLPAVLADAGRLYQILLNLVGNAVKFTDQGGVFITASSDGDAVTVAVRDTGIGIAADALPYVFDEFRQGPGHTSRRGGGAGLGLAIARQLADQMGGAISVESAPQIGSTFTLRLPAAVPERHPDDPR